MNIAQITGQVRPQTTERGQRFIQAVIDHSILLQVLMNFIMRATEHQYRPAAGGQTLEDRAVNANYSGEDLTPANLIAGMLAICGFTLDYDLTYADDDRLGIGIDQDTWYQQELDERAYETAKQIEQRIINGSGAANQILGLLGILDGSTNIPGLGVTGVIDSTTGSGLAGDSFDLTDSANWPLFLRLFERWQAELGMNLVVLCNRTTAGLLSSIARSQNDRDTQITEFGTSVKTIDGIPIVRLEDEAMPKTEPDNALTPVNETTSIILASNAVGGWNIGTNSGLGFWDVGELQNDMAERIKVEMRAKNEIKTKRSVRRIRNFKVA